MKDFYIKRTNKKIEIFLYCLILLLFLVPFLLINNLIFFEGYDVESNASVEVGRLKTSNLCYKGFEENLLNLNKVKILSRVDSPFFESLYESFFLSPPRHVKTKPELNFFFIFCPFDFKKQREPIVSGFIKKL